MAPTCFVNFASPPPRGVNGCRQSYFARTAPAIEVKLSVERLLLAGEYTYKAVPAVPYFLLPVSPAVRSIGSARMFVGQQIAVRLDAVNHTVPSSEYTHKAVPAVAYLFLSVGPTV